VSGCSHSRWTTIAKQRHLNEGRVLAMGERPDSAQIASVNAKRIVLNWLWHGGMEGSGRDGA
jgi:hypothetical protein